VKNNAKKALAEAMSRHEFDVDISQEDHLDMPIIMARRRELVIWLENKFRYITILCALSISRVHVYTYTSIHMYRDLRVPMETWEELACSEYKRVRRVSLHMFNASLQHFTHTYYSHTHTHMHIHIHILYTYTHTAKKGQTDARED
jgi:hypothetical protein